MKRIIRILPIIVLSILCGKAQAQTIVLDDFSSSRVNPGTGENIIAVYNGEDPGQTYSIGNGNTSGYRLVLKWNLLAFLTLSLHRN